LKRIFAFLVLAASFQAFVSAQETDPYDDEYWGEWLWEAEGLVVTEAAPPRRLLDGPVAVEVITAEEIQNSTAVTLVDVLTDHGMVLGDHGHHAGEHSGERIVMQGVDGGNVTILINGRRVAGRTGENPIAATLPLSNVERIEVIRGPQSVRYGTAVGGVINIITKEPEDRVTFSATFVNRFMLPDNHPDYDLPSAGFDPAREQNFSAIVGFPIGRSRNAIDTELSRGSYHFRDGGTASMLPQYMRGRIGFESIVPLGDVFDLNFGISGMFLRSEHQTAVVRGTGETPNPNWGQINWINRRDYVRLDAHAGLDWFVSDEVELNFGVSNSYWQREFDRYRHIGGAPGLGLDEGSWLETPFSGDENLTIVDMTGSWLFRPAIRFSGGIEGQWHTVNNERFVGNTLFWQNYEMFVEVEHFVSGRYSVALGVRAMYNPRFDPMAVPRLSGAVHLGNGFRLLAGVGMGYRVPTFMNLYSVVHPDVVNIGYGGQALGDPNLRPELSVGSNIGLEWAGTRAFFHINAFHTELWDQIDLPAINFANRPDLQQMWTDAGLPVPTGTFRAPRNLDRTFRTGFDAETRVNLPLNMFIGLGYSFVFGFDRNAGEEIRLSPPHAIRGRVGIDLPSPNLTANVNVRWNSGFSSHGGGPPYVVDATGVTVPAAGSDFQNIFTMGLFAAYRLNENWRITVAGDNILGTQRTAADPAAGTSGFAPVTFSLGVGFTM
jgi:outer membrane receptor for ferrienterochelin and colicin